MPAGRARRERAREPRGGGYRRLLSIIARSHGGPRQQREQRRRAAACFRTLRHAGIIDVVPYEAVRGRVVEVSGELQQRFLAAPHAVAVPGRRARAARSRAPTYALDVLTLVESILENPTSCCASSSIALKGEKMAELKAEGVEYEQRMDELEKLE